MTKLINTPDIRMGIAAVSRDCFPIALARRRLNELIKACRKLKLPVAPCETIVQTEPDALRALDELRKNGANALALYLGNFGPEGPTTILAQRFGGPFMLCGAAEESGKDLIDGRGDAFCGMLNAALNCGLRNIRAHIPPQPVGLPAEVAGAIAHFVNVSRVLVGLRGLKAFSFGPRPHDFFACNAPIKPLYDLGLEVMENSELDLLALHKSVAGRTREIDAIAADMAKELGRGNRQPRKLRQLAQFELALTTFFEANLGARQFGVFANKCWPAFESAFGFVPCYVNSRLAARGIPAACEVDLFGAVSEYMLQLAARAPATLLDINNTVPADIRIKALHGAARADLFMAFHCGNTPACCLCDGYGMKHQLIMHRLMEPDQTPDITCGTLEGRLKPGPVTLFRVQGTADCRLQSYVAEGRVLDGDPASFGAIGIIGIPGFARFYRHVLLEKQFPHHGAFGFAHVGRTLFDAVRLLGVNAVETPRPAGRLYPAENPFDS